MNDYGVTTPGVADNYVYLGQHNTGMLEPWFEDDWWDKIAELAIKLATIVPGYRIDIIEKRDNKLQFEISQGGVLDSQWYLSYENAYFQIEQCKTFLAGYEKGRADETQRFYDEMRKQDEKRALHNHTQTGYYH